MIAWRLLGRTNEQRRETAVERKNVMSRSNSLGTARQALSTMLATFAVLMLVSPLLAAAERLPEFDPVNSCRSGGALWGTPRQATESCVRSEHEARTMLEKSWNELLAADRTNCSRLITTGGQPSYVELLSCVEMARDARAYREKRAKNAAEPPPVVTAPPTVPKSEVPHIERRAGTLDRERTS